MSIAFMIIRTIGKYSFYKIKIKLILKKKWKMYGKIYLSQSFVTIIFILLEYQKK